MSVADGAAEPIIVAMGTIMKTIYQSWVSLIEYMAAGKIARY
jgi:hypothetical protein